MMGLGIGAIIGGYLSEKIRSGALFYCLIELIIGLFGCISIPFLAYIGKITVGDTYIVSFTGMFLFLCLPTILMGITLPLLTKICNSYMNNFFKSLSILYFINTLGAAIGCLFTSYLLISFYGLDTSIYVAAFLNILIALIVFIFKKTLTIGEGDNKGSVDKFVESSSAHHSSSLNTRLVYFIVFVTGFIAVGYEIIWFRVIGTIVKASPYAFSSILFIYLVGIALGSFFMKRYLDRHATINRKNLFFTFQFYISGYVLLSILAYYYLVKYVPVFSFINFTSFVTMEHPYPGFPRTDSISHTLKDVFNIFDVFLWPIVFISFPTLLMGASFPLITSLVYKNTKAASTVGRVYFFTVLGNAAGGIVTGLFLLSILGTENSILILSLTGLGFILFVRGEIKTNNQRYKTGLTLLIIPLAIFLFPSKHELYSVIHPQTLYNNSEKKIINEGLDGVIMTFSYLDKLSTYINGMSHGGRPWMNFYYEAIEALSFRKDPSSALVIGFGTGSTVETIQKVTPLTKVKLVELSPTLIKNLSQVDYLQSYLKNDNLDLKFADGRKYLSNSSEKFDAIFLDPLRTTTSFSNNLYSKQFFQLIEDRLSDKGVCMIWTDEHNIVPKTLCTVFPYVYKYSFFCIASNRDLKQDTTFKYRMFRKFPARYQEDLLKLDSLEPKPLNKSLILINTTKYPINDDYKPNCEYYIGLTRYY
jgi:predicted membrane-bound spermidine synthase